MHNFKWLALPALAAAAFIAAAPAKAATFTVSDAFGTGNFGTATGVFLADGTTAEITINMAPNIIVDTGSHFLATSRWRRRVLW